MPEELKNTETEETTEQTPEGQETTQETPDEPQGDAETFPLAYVQKLRTEAAEARTKAKRAEALEAQLFTAQVKATGRLVDPSDLAFNAELLEDPEGLTAAIDTLLAAKPHLAARSFGNVGQGVTTSNVGEVNLADMLRLGA